MVKTNGKERLNLQSIPEFGFLDFKEDFAFYSTDQQDRRQEKKQD